MMKLTREYVDSLWKRRAVILDVLEGTKERGPVSLEEELEAELDEIQEELFRLLTFLHTPAKAPKDA